MDVIKAKNAQYMKLGKPEARLQLVNDDDLAIISTYGAEYRGLINYYLLAGDVSRLTRVRWVMETSMLKTLACKYDSSVSKMAAKYRSTIETPHGPRRCFQASVERDGRKPLVARFGGIPLRRNKNAVLTDRKPAPVTFRRKELITGSERDGARCASTPARSKFTTSASSPTSTNRDGRNRRGWHSWPNGDARPSWSAKPATTPSTPATQPRHPRSSHRRAR